MYSYNRRWNHLINGSLYYYGTLLMYYKKISIIWKYYRFYDILYRLLYYYYIKYDNDFFPLLPLRLYRPAFLAVHSLILQNGNTRLLSRSVIGINHCTGRGFVFYAQMSTASADGFWITAYLERYCREPGSQVPEFQNKAKRKINHYSYR